MITSVRIVGEHVYIDRGSDPEDRSVLTFAEVKAAAEVLRAHLLAGVPPEIPGAPGPISNADAARLLEILGQTPGHHVSTPGLVALAALSENERCSCGNWDCPGGAKP